MSFPLSLIYPWLLRVGGFTVPFLLIQSYPQGRRYFKAQPHAHPSLRWSSMTPTQDDDLDHSFVKSQACETLPTSCGDVLNSCCFVLPSVSLSFPCVYLVCSTRLSLFDGSYSPLHLRPLHTGQCCFWYISYTEQACNKYAFIHNWLILSPSTMGGI